MARQLTHDCPVCGLEFDVAAFIWCPERKIALCLDCYLIAYMLNKMQSE